MNDQDTTPVNLSSVTIRPAEHADQLILRELFQESVFEGETRDNDTGADVDDLHAGYFADQGRSGFWVAVLDDEIVGMIGVQHLGEECAEIRRLRVRPSFRRSGIGSLLMGSAMAFCKQHGILKVILDVRIERAPAIALFEKFGFSHAKTREIDDRKLLDFYLNLYNDPTRA